MKVYITKYALTQGIFETNAEVCKQEDPTGNMIQEKSCYGNYYHKEGRDWHRDKESAIKRADKMRRKKIESLYKQIKKLQNLNFEDV